MKKYILLLFVLLVACESNADNNQTSLILELENEIMELHQQVDKRNLDLEKISAELKRLNKVTNDSRVLKNRVEELEEEIHKLQEELENMKKMELLHTSSIFSKEQIQVGSIIAGLVVSDIKKEQINGGIGYLIDFTGEFTVKGFIVNNHGGGGGEYSFIIDEDIDKVPHTSNEHEYGSVLFHIGNESELKSSLGEKADYLKNNPNGKIEVECFFKNYNYNYVPETDVRNKATFVRLK